MWRFSFLLVFLLLTTAEAAPYRPSDPAEVLEKVPEGLRGEEGKAFSQLRSKMEASPADQAIAGEFVRMSIERGRRLSDPRFFGYAEAEVNRILSSHPDVSEFLIYRGILKQRKHDFSAALTDLTRATKALPQNPQGWATLSAVQIVTGDYDGARKSCARLIPLSSALAASGCLALVGSLTGSAEKSYQSLDSLLQNAETQGEVNKAERLWAISILGEIAERLGRREQAEGWYKKALEIDPDDSFLLSAYADFLILGGRDAEVIPLLRGRENIDPLLLRLVVAEKHAKDPSFEKDRAQLAARFESEEARGESIHLRERAIYVSRIEEKAPEALAFAKRNWEVQKEPIDTLLLAELASRVSDSEALQKVEAWRKERGQEDVRVSATLSGGQK